jgi:hypothetical protein
MTAASEILLKQLKHLEEREKALKRKVGALNTELLELGQEQAGLTESMQELKQALDLLSSTQELEQKIHLLTSKEGKEDNGKRPKSKKAK